MSELVKSQSSELTSSWNTKEKLEMIKNQLTKDLTNDEFCLFVEIAKSTGLNPLKRQIYAIKRGKDEKAKMTIQTGIDGYRSIAARGGLHIGTIGPSFEMQDDRFPRSATVIVKKLVHGRVAKFEATAYWDEYAQFFTSYGKTNLGDLWQKFPKLMLGKCAEALALRRAFPEEMSGVYVEEEMHQADNEIKPISKGKSTLDAKKETVIEKSPAELFEELKALLEPSTKLALSGNVDGLKDWYENTLDKSQRKIIAPKMPELKKLCSENSHKFIKPKEASKEELDAFDAEFENVDMETGEIL